MADNLAMAGNLYPLVEQGEKTITIRKGHREYEQNEVVEVFNVDNPVQRMEITLYEVNHCLAKEIPLSSLKADGFVNQDHFYQGMKQYYPDFNEDTEVTVLEW